MMDGSLSAIFMDSYLPSLPFSWNEPAESTEDLKHLLVCASMELESARTAAKAQGKLHEARVRHLEELLKATRKERDEARELCLKLQERLVSTTGHAGSSLSTMMALPGFGNDNPTRIAERDSLSCNYIHSSIASSPSGLLQIDSVSSMAEPPSGSNFSELQWKFQHLQELEQQLHMQQIQKQQQQFSPPAILEELELKQPLELKTDDDCHLVVASSNTSSQLTSSTSLDDSTQFDLDLRAAMPDSSLDKLDLQQPQDWTASLAESVLPRQSSFPNMGSLAIAGMCPSAISGEVSNRSLAQCLQNGSAVTSLLTPMYKFGQNSSSRSLLPPRPVHLPEPPEADPQVMLKSLPEKGKLLQAVLQAGPLLQTLLLAGPLPQWRHPPPALDTAEAPGVSMSSPGSQAPLNNVMSGHSQSSAIDPMNASPPAPRTASPNLASRIGSTASRAQYTCPAGFCSTSRLLCSPVGHGHGLNQDIRLTGVPLKYAKIY